MLPSHHFIGTINIGRVWKKKKEVATFDTSLSEICIRYMVLKLTSSKFHNIHNRQTSILRTCTTFINIIIMCWYGVNCQPCFEQHRQRFAHNIQTRHALKSPAMASKNQLAFMGKNSIRISWVGAKSGGFDTIYLPCY